MYYVRRNFHCSHCFFDHAFWVKYKQQHLSGEKPLQQADTCSGIYVQPQYISRQTALLGCLSPRLGAALHLWRCFAVSRFRFYRWCRVALLFWFYPLIASWFCVLNHSPPHSFRSAWPELAQALVSFVPVQVGRFHWYRLIVQSGSLN